MAIGFVATGEPPAADSEPLADRGGLVTVTQLPNGPLIVAGSLEIVSGSGHTINRATRFALCPSGASQNEPFCDGAHARAKFEAP